MVADAPEGWELLDYYQFMIPHITLNATANLVDRYNQRYGRFMFLEPIFMKLPRHGRRLLQNLLGQREHLVHLVDHYAPAYALLRSRLLFWGLIAGMVSTAIAILALVIQFIRGRVRRRIDSQARQWVAVSESEGVS